MNNPRLQVASILDSYSTQKFPEMRYVEEPDTGERMMVLFGPGGKKVLCTPGFRWNEAKDRYERKSATGAWRKFNLHTK